MISYLRRFGHALAQWAKTPPQYPPIPIPAVIPTPAIYVPRAT